MANPDVDVRSKIEKALRAAHVDLWFYDDGYGFARHSDAMLLSYATDQPVRFVEALIDLLTNHTISGNRLATAAMVAVALRPPEAEAGEEFASHRVVYPPEQLDSPLPD